MILIYSIKKLESCCIDNLTKKVDEKTTLKSA